MAFLQRDLLKSASKWFPTPDYSHVHQLFSPYLIIKTRRPRIAHFESPWKAELSFQFRWLQFFLSLSLTCLQHLFTPPHPPDGPEHAQPSGLGASAGQGMSSIHPSMEQGRCFLAVLSSGLTARGQILPLALVEMSMPKC